MNYQTIFTILAFSSLGLGFYGVFKCSVELNYFFIYNQTSFLIGLMGFGLGITLFIFKHIFVTDESPNIIAQQNSKSVKEKKD